MQRLQENLQNKQGHYLFPFFWQKGQSNQKNCEYIEKMLEQGIYNLCLEPRPHPDYLNDGWWNTLDFIMEKAKKHNMKLWILDDAHFPTGYANGKVPHELRKRYLNYRRFDITGHSSVVELDLSTFVDMRTYYKDQRHQHDRFLSAILVERSEVDYSTLLFDTAKNVSDSYHENLLRLHLEPKHYSVYVLYITECGEEEATKDYLDPMRSEATQILIDEVYEPHYQHYGEEFGKTILNFFSDEPRFGNIKGMLARVGKISMPLPFNDLVLEKLNQRKEFNPDHLIFLFEGEGTAVSEMRFMYMDVVSQLYSENFTQKIGQWCKEHHVGYLGHTIEDNNAHARLGYGAGHYFRGLTGQTSAGIDIIGGQIVPGMDYHHDAFSTGGSDGEFYHYALVNLGASLAKLDSNKKGELMCEAFGAYGWVEGLKMMTYITNHMISHGVNMLVPHAFSPKEFPDFDCPPHFYAHGQNPQFPYFHYWSQMTDRLIHLFRGGSKEARVGVLYHGFAEWSGETMTIQKVMKVLQQNQINHDVISEDYLIDAEVTDHGYRINGFDYEVLIIPTAEYLPKVLTAVIDKHAQNSNIIFIDQLPKEYVNEQVKILKLDQLSQELSEFKAMRLSNNQKDLTVYTYRHGNELVYMLNNESINHTIKTYVQFDGMEKYAFYDAYLNKVWRPQVDPEKGIRIELAPYQAIVLIQADSDEHFRYQADLTLIKTIDSAEVTLYPHLEENSIQCGMIKIDDSLSVKFPKFCGVVEYKFELEGPCYLNCPEAYEIVEVLVDGQSLETRIAPNYRFDLTQLESGTHKVVIRCINNLQRKLRDGFSYYIPMEPLGILRPIEVYQYEN